MTLADFAHLDILRWISLTIEFFCAGAVLAAHREFVLARHWPSVLVATGVLLFVAGTATVIWSRFGSHELVVWYTPIFAVAAMLAAVGFLQLATRMIRRRLETRKELQ